MKTVSESERPSPGSSASEGSSPPPDAPRRFASATGFVLQGVGVVLLIASCVVWVATSRLAAVPKEQTPETWLHYLRGPHAGAAVLTLNLLVTLVGGLAFTAAGLGLQVGKRTSGRLAVASCSVLTLVYAGSSVFLLAVHGSLMGLLAVPPALLCGGLLVLCLRSAAVLRRHPPPSDYHVATPEILEEYRRRREERLREYDP